MLQANAQISAAPPPPGPAGGGLPPTNSAEDAEAAAFAAMLQANAQISAAPHPSLQAPAYTPPPRRNHVMTADQRATAKKKVEFAAGSLDFSDVGSARKFLLEALAVMDGR